MRRLDPMIGVAAVALTAAVLSACSAPSVGPGVSSTAAAPATTVITAPVPPPPGRAEIPPPAPSARALWTSGHWHWNGERYVWAPGRYIERPTPTANWRPGYWEQQPQGWLWVDGQWTS